MVKPNHAAENALATIGAVCWSLQIVPQLVKSFREKSTHGLSMWLMLYVISLAPHVDSKLIGNRTWVVSCLPFSAYIIAQDLSIPLKIQPHLFGFFGLVSVAQCLYYGRRWSLTKTSTFFVAFLMLWAGFETGSIYALRVRLGLCSTSRVSVSLECG
jgi:uncharacterized protein with PQ loop repeat